jgi:biotin operon repressor
MSGKAVGWVFDNSKTTSTTDLVVFVAIAEHAGHSVFEAWPSQEVIAKMCRLSERAVRNAIDRLAALGELSVIERRDSKGRRLRTYYRVVTDPAEQAEVAAKWASEHPQPPSAGVVEGPPAPRSGGQESVSPPASHDATHRHLTTLPTGISRQPLIEEPSTENRQREPSTSGEAPKSAPLVGEIVPTLNPGAVYVEACRLAGYDPLPSDVGRVGKAAKEARAQGKPDDLVRGACERLAQRNFGAPMFGRVLAELERGSNGQGSPTGRRRPTHQDTFDILDAFVAAERAS